MQFFGGLQLYKQSYLLHRAAIVYSLVDSCKALGVDPRSWMEDVLLRITACGNDRAALRELLPDRWEKESK